MQRVTPYPDECHASVSPVVGSMWRPLLRAMALLRHHKVSQVCNRFVRQAAQGIRSVTSATERGGVAWRGETPGLRAVKDRALALAACPSAQHRSDLLARGILDLAGHKISVTDIRDRATLECLPRLSRFHFHYQDYLADYVLLGANPSDIVWQLLAQWLAEWPLSRASSLDAWHPYCISRRVVSWSLIRATQPPPALSEAMDRSLFAQIRFLSGCLERDVGGNHLLENCRALALGVNYFDDRRNQRWNSLLAGILTTELDRQFDHSGEHFERSPYYHAEATLLLADLADLLEDGNRTLSDLCRRTHSRAQRFLANVCHPDGDIPLFGDGSLMSATRVSLITGRSATTVNDGATKQGGYWVWRARSDCVIVKCGPIARPELPAHAHSDLGSFEMSLGGKRFVVDSGTFCYQAGAMRDYCRSSAAHNVAVVNGASQADMWSSFRMGYRPRVVSEQSGQSDRFQWVELVHDGYRRMRVSSMARLVACSASGPWLICDSPSSPHCTVDSYLHLHPAVEVQALGPASALLRRDDQAVSVTVIGAERCAILRGWYCPAIGVRERASVLAWRAVSGSTGCFFSQPGHSEFSMALSGRAFRVERSGTGSGDKEVLVWDPDDRGAVAIQRKTK